MSQGCFFVDIAGGGRYCLFRQNPLLVTPGVMQYCVHMETMPRSAVIIIPKKPLATWANWAYSIQGEHSRRTFADFQNDCALVLIPLCQTRKEARDFINARWSEIFESELRRHGVGESLWPRDMTQAMFSQWFGFKFYSAVFDCK